MARLLPKGICAASLAIWACCAPAAPALRASGASGGGPVGPEGGRKHPEPAQPHATLDRARPYLVLALPRAQRDMTWLSRRLQAPLAPGPLRRFFSPTALKRTLSALLGGASMVPAVDLSRPAVLAVLERPGAKLRLAEQSVFTVALSDRRAFVEAFARRYGKPRREGSVTLFGGRGPALKIVGRRAYWASDVALLQGAEALFAPHTKGGNDAARLWLWPGRVRQRFGASMEAALHLLRNQRLRGGLSLMEPARRRAQGVLEMLWRGDVARVGLRFDADRLVLEGDVQASKGGWSAKGPARLARLWGAETIGPGATAAFFVAAPRELARLPLQLWRALFPAKRGDEDAAALRRLGERLEGPAWGATYAAKGGEGGVLIAARIRGGQAAALRRLRHTSRALLRALPAAWPALRERVPALRGLARRPRIRRRSLALPGGRGARHEVTYRWRRKLDGDAARWRRRMEAMGVGGGLELAHVVLTDRGGSYLLVAFGPKAGAALAAAARRAAGKDKAGELGRAWAERVGSRKVASSWIVSLTRVAEQALPLLAERAWGRLPWGALLRQVLPAPGAKQSAIFGGWVLHDRGVARLRLELADRVLSWVAKASLLLFRVGSYGPSGGGRPRRTP